ncbi:MAG TPA: CHAT domain-containing tetratricopeptide repeat protein [Croceibacterium sp.]
MEPEDAAGTTEALAPATQSLIAEIDTYSEGDQSKDPEGDLVKLTDLQRRVEADGQVPPNARGLLASAFGAAHFYANRYDRAVEFYAEAARLFEEGRAPPNEIAGLLNNQATILASLGRYDEAEASHLKALAIRRGIEGERGPAVSSSLFGLGYVYYREGRVEESIPYFRDSVEQQLEFNGEDDPLAIMRLASLASVLGRSGREPEALEIARRAETLGREHLGDDHPTYAITLNNLGNALIQSGRMQEAIPVLRETLRVRLATVGENASGTAISLRNLATALKETGARAEAEELNRRALAILEANAETDTPETFAYIYADLADLAALRGDWAAYDTLAGRSLEEADKRLGEADYNRAQVHLYHADRLRQRGRIGEALEIAERWTPVLAATLIPSHKDRIYAELLLARLRQEAGSEREALPLADAAIAQLGGKLGGLGTTDRQLVREAASNRDSALLYFAIATAADDPQRAFAALQLVNISDLALSQQLAGEAEGNDGTALAARDEVLALARKASQLEARFAAALEAQDGGAETLRGELDAARGALAAAERQLRSDFPEFVARYRPAPVALTELQASLEPDELLVMPLEAERQGWTVTLDRARGLAWQPFDQAELAARAGAIRRAVDSPADLTHFPLADAAALYRMLLPDGVSAGGKLLVHGGRLLSSLPLALLLTEDWAGSLDRAPWLITRASVQVLGNLEIHLRRHESVDTLSGEMRMVGIGGADLPAGADAGVALAGLFRSGRPAIASIGELPPLPNAAEELRAIAAALPGENDLILVGPDAAEESLKRADLSQARVLAFATHGLVSGELRGLWEPALLIGTAEGSGEDGLLGASEIARLRLNADWVILSACNTASGEDAGAPAYSGLASAFAQAGARSLMLSHWRVRDDAAARLSVSTVRGASGGLPRAEALRRAQLALIADRELPGAAHPAIWAPFVIVEN